MICLVVGVIHVYFNSKKKKKKSLYLFLSCTISTSRIGKEPDVVVDLSLQPSEH